MGVTNYLLTGMIFQAGHRVVIIFLWVVALKGLGPLDSHEGQLTDWDWQGTSVSTCCNIMSDSLHSWKLTWNLNITHLQRKFIFQTCIIAFHVSFRGCNTNLSWFWLYLGLLFDRVPSSLCWLWSWRCWNVQQSVYLAITTHFEERRIVLAFVVVVVSVLAMALNFKPDIWFLWRIRLDVRGQSSWKGGFWNLKTGMLQPLQ